MNLSSVLLVPCLFADPQTEQALRTFAKEYASPAAVVRAQAVADLAKLKNVTTRSKLGGLLTVDEDAVRIAAAEGLGAWTEERDKVAALLTSALAPNAKAFDVEAALLGSLGKLGDDSALPSIHRCFDSRDPKDVDFKVAKAAIKAAGILRSRDSMDPLLDLSRRCEKALKAGGAKQGGSSAGAGLGIAGGGSADPQVLRAKALSPVILRACQSITKESWVTLAEWEIWWEKHKAHFQVEK